MVVAKEEGEDDDAVQRHRLFLSLSCPLPPTPHLTHDIIDISIIINHFISISSISQSSRSTIHWYRIDISIISLANSLVSHRYLNHL